MSEKQIEQEIKDKDLNAPRITPEQIDQCILLEQYYVFPGTTLIVCCLTLRNGFNVIGEAACVSPENFDRDIGRRIAFEDARRKIWMLEGYLLREFLLAESLSNQVKVNQETVDQNVDQEEEADQED